VPANGEGGQALDPLLRSARTRAIWTIVLVGLCSVVSVVAGVQGAVRLAQLDRLAGTCLVSFRAGCRPVAEATFSAADDLRFVTIAWWVAEIVLVVVAAIPWLMWQFRGHELLRRRLATPGLRITPGWAVGWWFVPFANLGKPAVAMAELWRASGGEDETRGVWTTRRLPAVFAWWWGFWVARVACYFVANAATNAETPSLGTIRTETLGWVLQSAAAAVAGVLAIVVIRSIQVRLELARPYGMQAVRTPGEASPVGPSMEPAVATAGPVQPDDPAHWPPAPGLVATVPVQPATVSVPPPGRASRPLAVVGVVTAIVVSAVVVAASPRIVVRPGASAAPTASPSVIERFPTPEDWIEHSGPGDVFVIEAPPDWRERGGGTDFQLASLGSAAPKVLTTGRERLRGELPLEQYVSLSVANIEKAKRFRPVDEVVVSPVTLPAGPSEVVRFHVSVAGERAVVIQYYLIDDEVAWVLSYFAPGDREEDFAPEFEEMSSTLRFTD